MLTIREIFAALPPAKQAEHSANFATIAAACEKMVVDHCKAKRQKPKQFEVHHAIEHARGIYLKTLEHNAHSPWQCKRAVIAAYPGHEALFT